MAQLLVRADNGQVAHVAPDDHVWGLRECWPSFVVLRVPQSVAAAQALVNLNQNDIGRAFVNLDGLSAQAIADLADTGAADIASLALITVADVPGQSTQLTQATEPKAAEKAAFVTWGLDPTPANRAAYEAIRDTPGGNSQPAQVKPRGR